MAISFDGVNKIATLSSGTTSLSVLDLWSRWVDWLAIGTNSKYLPMFRFTGGDDIDVAAGTTIPIYTYLTNGWRIMPQSANHTLRIFEGVLLVDGGGDPFLDVSGYTVRINYSQPVQAITVATGGGGGATAEDIASAVRAELAVELARIDAAISSAAPSAIEVAVAIRNELAVELARIDASISSRVAAGVVNVNVTKVNGVTILGVGTDGDPWRQS